jgi:SAM-dependent methyltransferase
VGQYDRILNQGLAISGETKEYFARGRIAWLARCLQQIGFRAETVLDFGCGTGTSTPYYVESLGAKMVIGVDLSAKSLGVAREFNAGRAARFCLPEEYQPDASVDLAFCNGVFHHIRPPERPSALRYIVDSLRPGGLLAFWENNPWNPGTRYIMSRVSFDRDAMLLSAPTSRSLLRCAGLAILRTDYCFVFPRFLRLLRRLEPRLSRLPFGAQYEVLCRKP